MLAYIISFALGAFFGLATMCLLFYARGDGE